MLSEPGAWPCDHMHAACLRLAGYLHIHASAAAMDENMERLLTSTLSDYCSGPGRAAEAAAAAGRAGQVAVTVLSLLSGGSGSLLSEGINLLFGLLYF